MFKERRTEYERYSVSNQFNLSSRVLHVYFTCTSREVIQKQVVFLTFSNFFI